MRTLWIFLGCFLVFGQAHAGWVPVATVNEKTPGHLCDVDDNGLDLFCGGNNPQLMANGGISSTSISTTVINFEGVTATSVLGAGGNFIVSGTTSVSASNAGTIKFATAGSERMVIDGTGNVGIGTNSPIAAMHVQDASSSLVFAQGRIELARNESVSPNSGGLIDLKKDSSDDTRVRLAYKEDLGTGSSKGFVISLDQDGGTYDAANRFSILDNGNVGIGTLNSQAPLEILSSRDLGANEQMDDYATLDVQSGTAGVGIGQVNGTPAIFGYGTGTAFNLVLNPNDGNVGIGTGSPASKFHVRNGNTSARFTLTDGSQSTLWLIDESSGKIWQYKYHMNGNRLSIMHNDGSQWFEYLSVLDSNGYVGIDDPSPDYKLDVNGTAYATGAAGALSDRRHKKAIKDLPVKGLETITKLRPVQFAWKDPQDAGMEGAQFGFIAQEVEEVLPQVILTQDDEQQTKGMKPTALIPVLTKAIQELKTENEALKAEKDAEINALKAEMREMKQMLEAR